MVRDEGNRSCVRRAGVSPILDEAASASQRTGRAGPQQDRFSFGCALAAAFTDDRLDDVIAILNGWLAVVGNSVAGTHIVGCPSRLRLPIAMRRE